jgi:tetratricopeptide (TPR) repeat protein
MSDTSVLMREVEDSMSSGEWDQAIEKLEQLTKNEVKTSDVFSKLAQANAVRGRFLTVLSVYLEWADCAIESGDVEQAEQALGYAQNLRPDSPEVHEMAVKVARQKLSPDLLVDRLVELAHLHLEKGDVDRSVALILEAVEARPEDDSLTLQLGEIYISAGQIGSGLRIFEKFVEKHSDCGEPSKLLEPLKRINLLKADDIESTLHLGRVYLALDRVDKAEEQFRAVLRLDLENQDALLELARVCQKNGRFRNGLLALNRVVQLNPDLPLARRRMGELHLASGSPQEAVKEFLEAARLYSEAEEIDNMIEVYRTILRFDDNTEAMSRLRSLSFTEKYNEDLTANLFPPVEEETEEEFTEESLDEPDERATRPAPVAPETAEPNEEFQEIALIEEEPKKSVELGLTPRRPAMVRKAEFAQSTSRKPTLLPSGHRRKEQKSLRYGLDRKDQKSGKPRLNRKPNLPQKQEMLPPEPVEAPMIVAEPVSPQESPFEEAIADNENAVHKADSTIQEPSSILNETEMEIPAFEEVFEPDAKLEKESPDPIGAPAEVQEEICPEKPFEPLFEEMPIEEVEEQVAEAAEPEAVVDPSVELEIEVVAESEQTTAPQEIPIDAGFLFPSDDDSDDIFKNFEDLEKGSIFDFEDDWTDFDQKVQDAPLFPSSESETEAAPQEDSETVSEEPTRPEPQPPQAEEEPAEIVEESTSMKPATPEPESLENELEDDLSWLFETEDVSNQEILPDTIGSPIEPVLEEVNIPAIVEEAEESPVFQEQETPTEEVEAVAPLAPESEDTEEPKFGWVLESNETNEPDASPLFPIEDVPMEDQPLFPIDETEPVFNFDDTFLETSTLFPVEDVTLEKLTDETPAPVEENQSDEESDFQAWKAKEISLLVDEDELNPETPELIQILQETLPFQPQADSGKTETPMEPIEPLVESPAVTEASAQVEDEVETMTEAGDVATRIEVYRDSLATFPTDEKATLALADTCLQYGMLEDALEHYQRLQIANPSCRVTSARIIKAALWMEDFSTVKSELWKSANLSFDVGDLKTCQDRLGDLLSLEREHKQARQLMVEVFLAGGQEKLAAWHLSQMVERAIAEKEFDLAIASLKRLQEVSPNDAALEKLGELYQEQNQNREALKIFRGLRTTHLEKENHADAVRLARQVVALDPERADDREVLVTLLLRQGFKAEVLEQRLELAELYRNQDNIDNAIDLLQGVLREAPENLDAERLLVELHLQNRSIELAEQHAESLAERFLEQKAYEKAINLFEYWVGAAPSAPRTRERLAQFYQLNGDLDGAKMEWLVVTESHHAAGDFQRAARSLERALELEPQQSEWRLRLAQLKAQELNQVESALQDFRILFQADPKWRKATVSYLELLMEQSRMPELGEVLQVLERVSPGSDLKDSVFTKVKNKMAAEPDNLVLAFGWGELCLALGMLDLAIEQFQRLRRHEEYQLHSYRLLGLCFSRKKGFNMVELALSQFRRGLALEGGSSSDRLELRYDLATVLKEHGRQEEALEQFQLITSEDPNYRDVAKLLAELG